VRKENGGECLTETDSTFERSNCDIASMIDVCISVLV